MSFESLSHLMSTDAPDYTLVPICIVLGAAVLALCFLFPCLPDGSKSKSDEPYYGTETGVISSLHVYPVKSCAGHEVPRWKIGRTGMQFDRQWVVVGKEGRFRSQRRLPKMALIQPSLPTSATEPLTFTVRDSKQPPLTVPVITAQDPGARLIEIGIWSDNCIGVDQGDAAAAWLSEVLGEEGLRLLRMDDAYSRPTDPAFGKGFVAAFADGFPLLLASEESLEDLNSKLQQPIGMERFRPNIVVSGLGAWAEDDWTKVAINDAVFRVVKPCDRCQVPTIDQAKGELTGPEPTATLSTFRSGKHLGFEGDSAVFFGQNLLHESRGEVRVNDTFDILRVRKIAAPAAAPSGTKKDD